MRSEEEISSIDYTIIVDVSELVVLYHLLAVTTAGDVHVSHRVAHFQ